MALAAEDDEAASQVMPPPRHSTRFSSNRSRHPATLAGSFVPGLVHSHLAHASSDPMAAITQSLLGGGSFDLESSQALLASLMADFEATRAHSSSRGMGSGHQDMSYEALTNLEDVKLTAPPELLATMPLDMCLKGGPWDDKVQCQTCKCCCCCICICQSCFSHCLRWQHVLPVANLQAALYPALSGRYALYPALSGRYALYPALSGRYVCSHC